MKIRFLMFALTISFLACQTETADIKTQIAELEKAVSEKATPENSDQLIDLYNNYIKENASDKAIEADYTYKAALLAYNQKRSGKTAALKAPLESTIAYQLKAMFDESTQKIVPEAAKGYINSCELFAELFATDEKAATYLFEGAEKARIIQNYDVALGMFDKLLKKFPNHPKAAQSMFLKAFTLDDNLKQFDKAKVIYEAFLAKYPNDDFADDTQFLLKNLGKSDDQIIESFGGAKKQ